MGRRSMDELLTAFDPLHPSSAPGSSAVSASQPSPLFASGAATSSSSAPSQQDIKQPRQGAARHVPVLPSHAPLDLLSFDDYRQQPQATNSTAAQVHSQTTAISGQSGENDTDAVRARAARRQEEMFKDLSMADQSFDIPTAHPTPRQRRPSSGFSPPRRMSRSGLMHNDAIHGIRSGSGSGDRHSPQLHLQPQAINIPHLHSTATPTQISEEPADLFHPSSPPAGSTLETLKNSSYFSSFSDSSATSPTQPQSPSQTQAFHSIFDKPLPTNSRQRRTSTSDREAFHTLNDGVAVPSVASASTKQTQNQQQEKKPPLSSRAAFIQNALRTPAPPFASPTLHQSTNTSRPQPAPGSSNVNPPVTVNSPQQPQSSEGGSKPVKRPTFDFPSFSSLGQSSGGKSRDSPLSSNTPSPASSLIIDSDPLPPIILKVTGAARDSRRVMNEDIADGIRAALPPRIKLCKTWTLLYSLDAHGTSISTLYSRVQSGMAKAAGGCVLLVEDMKGGIFGAYVNEAFKKSESYYGNGECFLWKVESFPADDNFRVGPIVRTYRWTARNDYLILSDSTFLSVGGGDGKFGLWIDSNFDKGFTTSCPAFANDPLCAPSLIKTGVDGHAEGKFEIMAVECWAVG